MLLMLLQCCIVIVMKIKLTVVIVVESRSGLKISGPSFATAQLALHRRSLTLKLTSAVQMRSQYLVNHIFKLTNKHLQKALSTCIFN